MGLGLRIPSVLEYLPRPSKVDHHRAVRDHERDRNGPGLGWDEP